MPLNVPKAYRFTPHPVGPVRLSTRSAKRGRLYAGGTFFRSKERGEPANLLELTVVEDLTVVGAEEGLLVEHHRAFRPDEQVSVTGMSPPPLDLLELNLGWDQELRLGVVSGAVRARIYSIRWQIAGGETLVNDLGVVSPNRLLTVPGLVSLRLRPFSWPLGGVTYLRPRTHRYPLVPLVISDPDSMSTLTGWDPQVLRTTLNGSGTAWVRMPSRPAYDATGLLEYEDVVDEATALKDGAFVTTFGPSRLIGGDGLPAAPVGLNTGPDRVLVHLNYSERDDGSLGELNQVFEWSGDSATVGGWTRYA